MFESVRNTMSDIFRGIVRYLYEDAKGVARNSSEVRSE